MKETIEQVLSIFQRNNLIKKDLTDGDIDELVTGINDSPFLEKEGKKGKHGSRSFKMMMSIEWKKFIFNPKRNFSKKKQKK